MHLRNLSDDELLAQTKTAVLKERDTTLGVLHHLREVERRQLFAPSHSSHFDYCVHALGYDAGSAQLRISAMRLLRDLPELEQKVESGGLNLTLLAQAQSFFRKEAISLPTEAAAKIALRTQQIIAFETGVTDTVDPLAGSYFIEALTDELEKAAQDYIDKIDAMGGSVKAIEQDYMQQEIARSAYEYQNEIESGEKVLVGVNRFTQPEETALNVFRVDDSIRKMQTQKITALKNIRNNRDVNHCLLQLGDAAKGTQNLMPFILNAVECYATLGEIADTMRNVFGEY